MSTIGLWVARFKGERQITLWHLIESEIEDRVVTNCGRQMTRRSQRGMLLVESAPGYDACHPCQPEPMKVAA